MESRRGRGGRRISRKRGEKGKMEMDNYKGKKIVKRKIRESQEIQKRKRGKKEEEVIRRNK